MAAVILRFPTVSLPRYTRSEMSRPIRFGGMGVGDFAALADAAHIGAAGLPVGSAICFFTTQDALVRENTHDNVPRELTMYGRPGTAMVTTVSRRPSAPVEDDGDNEPCGR
jgi:NAD(P)H-dependent flavin oxidoreductase YrpB (nitropropane dioxygenase family)